MQKSDVPTGSKRVKEGTGAVAVAVGGVDYIYLLKGSGTFEFYRYNLNTDVWDTSLPSAPSGASGKTFKNGSCLTYDGGDTIYALKGSYNEFFAYSISARTWATRETLPRICPPGTSKKKVKDGAGIAVVGRALYALKGGNTNEFWMYARDDRRWSPAAQMPTVTKKVKGGGALDLCVGRARVMRIPRQQHARVLELRTACGCWGTVVSSRLPQRRAGAVLSSRAAVRTQHHSESLLSVSSIPQSPTLSRFRAMSA